MSDQTTYHYAPKCDFALPEVIDFTVHSRGSSLYVQGGLKYEIHCGGERLGRIYGSEDLAIAGAAEDIQFIIDFWSNRLYNRTSECWVIDQKHYMVGPESEDRRGPLGHGGREFWIRPLAPGIQDTIFPTRNLWSQGRVPDFFRDYFPDTGEFVYPVPDKPGEYTTDPAIAFPSPAHRRTS